MNQLLLVKNIDGILNVYKQNSYTNKDITVDVL